MAALDIANCKRHSLYSQNVNLYLAPTADARDTWLPLMRTIACEGRAVVLSANQCMRRRHLPPWIIGDQKKRNLNGSTSSSIVEKPNRRTSIVTKTEDNHEITWPPTEARSSKPGVVDDTLDDEMFTSRALAASGASVESGAEIDATRRDLKSAAMDSSTAVDSEEDNEFVSRGGSSIIGAMGEVLAGPLWDVEDGGLLSVEVDFEDCERGRLDLDVAGSYSRNDAFQLIVKGLDITPPP